MKSPGRDSGGLAALAGLTLFVAFGTGYFAVTRLHGRGQPMCVSLGAAPPLVIGSTARAPDLEVCVTPRSMGDRTRVRIDGRDVFARRETSAHDVPAACPGSTIAVSPRGLAPGIHRLTFTSLYSGRYERGVDLSAAVGPFEDRKRWIPCAARIWIGQDFLDAPGEQARDLSRAIERLLLRRRFSEPCLRGSVVDADVHVSWTGSGVAMSAMMRLDTGDVLSMKAALDLTSRDGQLHAVVPPSSVSATLAGPALACAGKHYSSQHPVIAFLFATQVAREIKGRAHENVRDRAAQLIDKELLGPVRDLLEAPRPLHLANRKEAQLEVRYGRLDIHPDSGALLCLDLRPTTARHVERITPGPPRLPQSTLASMRQRRQTLRMDLSLRALNATLDAAWRVGLLDRLLAESSGTWTGILEHLTVRPTAMTFELPPVIQPGRSGPHVTVGDLRVALADREHPERPSRIGDFWARADLGAAVLRSTTTVQLTARLRDFGLSCQESGAAGRRLEPCFPEAVQIMKDRFLDRPIAAGAVGTVMVPLEKWLPGQGDGKAALAVNLQQAELRPAPRGDWYQLFADVRVRDTLRR